MHVASIQYGDGDEDEDGHDSGVEVMDVDGKVKVEKRQEIDADEVFGECDNDGDDDGADISVAVADGLLF